MPELTRDEIETICRRVIADHHRQAEGYRVGHSVMGFFVGQVMIATNGNAHPRTVNEIMHRLLMEGRT